MCTTRKDNSRASTVTGHQLPNDIWAHVFEYLKPNSTFAVDSSSEDDVAQVMADQACLHRLKLVCSKFRNVFAQHPELSDEISINKAAAHTFAPSVLLWVLRWGSSVCRFSNFSGEQHQNVMLVLGTLACTGSSLKSVFLKNAPPSAVCALPVFSTLVRCDFDHHPDPLNLSALKKLPSSKELYLTNGDYTDVPSAGYLTRLWVQCSAVQISAVSVEDISLGAIFLDASILSGLHDSGLAACKALQQLEISNVVFNAALEDDILRVGDTYMASIPAIMSELTCLTYLYMELASSSHYQFDIHWVYSLVALKHLQLHISGTFEVSAHLTQLTQLTRLKFVAVGTHQASYSSDWEAMQTLKYLAFDGQISFDTQMLQLTTITSLRHVELTNLHPCAGNSTASNLIRLIYQLAARCPQVQVHVDGTLVG